MQCEGQTNTLIPKAMINIKDIPSEILQALRALDYLGFESIERAILEIRKHSNWSALWDVSEITPDHVKLIDNWVYSNVRLSRSM